MRRATRIGSVLAALCICVPDLACGKSSTDPTPPTATNIITILPGAIVDPKNILIQRGSQVTFVNHDSQKHDMESDPHPDHTDCPELASVGLLNPGESRQSGNLNVSRTCGYHDHLNDGREALRGTIVIE